MMLGVLRPGVTVAMQDLDRAAVVAASAATSPSSTVRRLRRCRTGRTEAPTIGDGDRPLWVKIDCQLDSELFRMDSESGRCQVRGGGSLQKLDGIATSASVAGRIKRAGYIMINCILLLRCEGCISMAKRHLGMPRHDIDASSSGIPAPQPTSRRLG